MMIAYKNKDTEVVEAIYSNCDSASWPEHERIENPSAADIESFRTYQAGFPVPPRSRSPLEKALIEKGVLTAAEVDAQMSL